MSIDKENLVVQVQEEDLLRSLQDYSANGKDLQEQVLKYLTNLDQKWERLHTCMASTRRRLCIFITLHPNESDL